MMTPSHESNPPEPPDVQLTGAHRTPEEKQALGYLMANLSMPGIGSWMAGRKFQGAIQLLLAMVGQLFTLLGFFTMLAHILSHGTGDAFATPGIITAFSGLGLFLLAWIWALMSSWVAVQKAKDEAFESNQP